VSCSRAARHDFIQLIRRIAIRWGDNTPPDSPRQLELRTFNPEIDVYAIPSQDGESFAFYQVAAVFATNMNLSFAHTENHYCYFIAIIDVLTLYGVKKQVRVGVVAVVEQVELIIESLLQAAKAAKTVKYGSNVDGISTCDPEQYAKRFLEFMMDKVIE